MLCDERRLAEGADFDVVDQAFVFQDSHCYMLSKLLGVKRTALAGKHDGIFGGEDTEIANAARETRFDASLHELCQLHSLQRTIEVGGLRFVREMNR